MNRKRDPTDLSREEVEGHIKQYLHASFLHSENDQLPGSDYKSGGQEFWWRPKIERWAQGIAEAGLARQKVVSQLRDEEGARLAREAQQKKVQEQEILDAVDAVLRDEAGLPPKPVQQLMREEDQRILGELAETLRAELASRQTGGVAT